MDGFQRLLADRLGYPAPRGAIADAERATGVKGNVIGRWMDRKSPKRPSPKNLEKFAPYLGVDYDELLRLVYSAGEVPGPPEHPVTPHDRLLRVADVLAAAVAEIRLAAVTMRDASQPTLNPGMDQSHPQTDGDYVYQVVRPIRVPLAFPVNPRLGDRRLVGVG